MKIYSYFYFWIGHSKIIKHSAKKCWLVSTSVPPSRSAPTSISEQLHLCLCTLLPCTLLPGHWGQHSPGSTSGLEHASGGHLFIKHWTFPFCNKHKKEWNKKLASIWPDVINSHDMMLIILLTVQVHVLHMSVGWGNSSPLVYSLPP